MVVGRGRGGNAGRERGTGIGDSMEDEGGDGSSSCLVEPESCEWSEGLVWKVSVWQAFAVKAAWRRCRVLVLERPTWREVPASVTPAHAEAAWRGWGCTEGVHGRVHRMAHGDDAVIIVYGILLLRMARPHAGVPTVFFRLGAVCPVRTGTP